jgi:hypothetical protein
VYMVASVMMLMRYRVLRLKGVEQGVYNAKVFLGDDRSGTEVRISIG